MQKLDRQTMLDAVRDLPLEEQLELVREVLAGAQSAEATKRTGALRDLSALNVWLNAKPAVASGRASAASLRGIARMDNLPDDATVDQWIDEHRMEWYGS